MSEFLYVHGELVWVRVLSKMAESKMAEIQDGCHHQINQIELVWVRVWECAENGWIQEAVAQSYISRWLNHQVESEWMNEVFFCAKSEKMVEFKIAILKKNEWVKFFLFMAEA